MKTVIIMTSESLSEAHILKDRLLNEGIDCFLTNENFTNLMPLCNNMLGSGIQLIVLEKDSEKGREILKYKIEPNKIELICPNCGSQNIDLGFGKKQGLSDFQHYYCIVVGFSNGKFKTKILL